MDTFHPISPLRVVTSFALAALLALRSFRKKSLSVDGAVGALVVGGLAFSASYRFGIVLMVFFYSSSLLTKWKAAAKSQVEAEYREGGQRDVWQVLANGGLQSALAAAHLWLLGSGDATPVDFETHPVASTILCAYVGAYACCCGDTWASEIGVTSTGGVWLVTTGRRVPRGTNGGISVLGTVASGLGGALVGVAWVLGDWLVGGHPFAPVMILVGAAAGLFGSFVDSLLGATLQLSSVDEQGRVHSGLTPVAGERPQLKRVTGIDVLGNDTVNALSALTMSAVTVGMCMVAF